MGFSASRISAARQLEDSERDHAGEQRRRNPAGNDLPDLSPLDRFGPDADRSEADDRADDRMRGRNRQPKFRRDEQQCPGGREGRQHAPDQLVLRQQGQIEHALAHRVGHVCPGEESTGKLEDARHDDGAHHRERTRAHTGPHGIGYIVRANCPRHVERQSGRKPELKRNRLHPTLFPNSRADKPAPRALWREVRQRQRGIKEIRKSPQRQRGLERETRIELAAAWLGTKCSTTELLPQRGALIMVLRPIKARAVTTQ